MVCDDYLPIGEISPHLVALLASDGEKREFLPWNSSVTSTNHEYPNKVPSHDCGAVDNDNKSVVIGGSERVWPRFHWRDFSMLRSLF
jgi:hypothetical protein